MLERSYKLRKVRSVVFTTFSDSVLTQHIQPIDLFLKSADSLYGPITTIRHNGRIEKKIPWSAFALTERDWERVADARDILKVTQVCCR